LCDVINGCPKRAKIFRFTYFLILNDVQDSAPDGTADGVAAERVEVLDAALAEVVGDLLCCDHSCNGMTITLKIFSNIISDLNLNGLKSGYFVLAYNLNELAFHLRHCKARSF
jgi:hypothetical protein